MEKISNVINYVRVDLYITKNKLASQLKQSFIMAGSLAVLSNVVNVDLTHNVIYVLVNSQKQMYLMKVTIVSLSNKYVSIFYTVCIDFIHLSIWFLNTPFSTICNVTTMNYFSDCHEENVCTFSAQPLWSSSLDIIDWRAFLCNTEFLSQLYDRQWDISNFSRFAWHIKTGENGISVMLPWTTGPLIPYWKLSKIQKCCFRNKLKTINWICKISFACKCAYK